MMSHQPPLISVIIPAHNAAGEIGEQLDALRAQEDAPRFEVLVCDNNSTDGTAEVARSQASGLDLRIVDAAGPGSASFARNRGADAARGDYLLFCDADDLVDPRWVAELSAPLTRGARVLTAGALHHERFNDSKVLAAYGIGEDPEPTFGVVERATRPYAGFLPTVPGGNFGIGRALYLSLGGMDHSFPGGAEETDFAWRAQKDGAEVITCDGAVVHYRLKSAPRALFRQQRIQNCARVMLWTRYREHGMTGPSARYSVEEILRALPGALFRSSRAERLLSARLLGGHVGALQGILRFRLLRRVPPAQLAG